MSAFDPNGLIATSSMLGRIIISAVIIVLVLVWLAAICLMVMGPQNVAHISRGFY
jgi:hypothetical protein